MELHFIRLIQISVGSDSMFNSATAVQESLAQNKTISFFRLLLFIRSVLFGKKVKKDGKICSKKIKQEVCPFI